jgi:Uma2 family endonuclease
MAITHIEQLNPDGYYTYADYLLWQFQERVELLRGRLRQMAAPNVRHQKISGALFSEIKWFLKKTPCQVFAAPFDVRLPIPSHLIKGDKVDTVVQPDICIICDPSKLDEQGCVGPPDLVVEILSPANSKKEMREKYEIYQEAGITEYWVIFPNEMILQRYILGPEKRYVAQGPNVADDKVGITFLPSFSLSLEEIFQE